MQARKLASFLLENLRFTAHGAYTESVWQSATRRCSLSHDSISRSRSSAPAYLPFKFKIRGVSSIIFRYMLFSHFTFYCKKRFIVICGAFKNRPCVHVASLSVLQVIASPCNIQKAHTFQNHSSRPRYISFTRSFARSSLPEPSRPIRPVSSTYP